MFNIVNNNKALNNQFFLLSYIGMHLDQKSYKYNLGPHVHFKGDFDRLIEIHKSTGASLFQVFRKPLNTLKNLDKFSLYAKQNNIKLVVHSSYSANIATNWDKNTYWILNLEDEIEFAHHIGAFGVVIHFGKSMTLKLPDSYNNMFTSLTYLHHKTSHLQDVKMILETSAGQGTEMCSNFEDLQKFYNKFKVNEEMYNRIKLCIDTCHIFAAGYDLRTKKNVKEYLHMFNKQIGINNIILVHLNDSKTPLGGKLDRHEILGKGYIGKIGLLAFFKFCVKHDIPMVIETYRNYKDEIKFLINTKKI